jgi:hypothetical protein
LASGLLAITVFITDRKSVKEIQSMSKFAYKYGDPSKVAVR